MSELLAEATQAWAEQSKVPRAPARGMTAEGEQFDDDNEISGADFLQWFAEWRVRARLALDAAGVP